MKNAVFNTSMCSVGRSKAFLASKCFVPESFPLTKTLSTRLNGDNVYNKTYYSHLPPPL